MRFPIKWHPHTHSYLEFNYSLQFLFFSFTFFFPLTKAYQAKASASSQFTFIISINELIYNLSYANNRCSSKQILYLSTLFSSPKTTLKFHNSSIITTINICCINGPSLGQTYIILLVAGPTIFFFCFSFYNFYNSFFKLSIPGLDSFVGSFCFLFFHHSSIFINSSPTTCLGLIDKIHKCSRESVPCILHAPMLAAFTFFFIYLNVPPNVGVQKSTVVSWVTGNVLDTGTRHSPRLLRSCFGPSLSLTFSEFCIY